MKDILEMLKVLEVSKFKKKKKKKKWIHRMKSWLNEISLHVRFTIRNFYQKTMQVQAKL